MARPQNTLVLVIFLLLSSSATAERHSVVIIHTNDTHSAFLPEPARWRPDKALVGGSVAMEAFVRAERARWQRLLVLDAGDILTGTPLSEIEVDGAKGGAMIDFMEAIDYDAMVIGNHEFDQGADNVDALVANADFAVLSANLFHSDGTPYAHAAGKVFDLDGVTVGVVGLTSEELPDLLHADALESFIVTPAAAAARQWIDSLTVQPDVLVALTHLGLEKDEELAKAVPDLDLIVGGHHHDLLREARVVGTTRIVHAGERLKYAGRVRLDVEDGEIVAFHSDVAPLLATDIKADSRLAAEVRRYEDRIDELYGEVVGELGVEWRRVLPVSNVGIWLAEALADDAGADFGLMNSGGIRKNIPAGPITRLDIHEMLPFQNYLSTCELTGGELLALLRLQAARVANRKMGLLQLGYLRAPWRYEDGELVLVEPTIRGRAIDPSKTYVGASTDYVLVSQTDFYLGMDKAPGAKVYPDLLSSVIERQVRKAGRIEGQADDRLSPVRAELEIH